jgi:SAM-dependent methyltransferase
MTVSLFTPTHDTRFLRELYDSIKHQPFHEWVVVYNNGATPIDFKDERVKSFTLDFAPEWVGPLKKYACERCTGDILLEMDHDDLLMPTAIEEVLEAFKTPDVGFVYSNSIHCTDKFEPVNRFDPRYGWEYREATYKGHKLEEHVSFPPTPNAVGRIWFAPNHLRAFRRDIYNQIGGYNKDMRILDDLDLMCRMYQVTRFKHIDKGLYIYRVHGKNSWLKYNAEIQKNVYRIHDQYIEDLCLRWADMNGLRKLDLGGAIDTKPGYEVVDIYEGDVKCDLNERWPFDDDSVGVVRAYDIFEHLRDPIHTMKELYRVLSPGGYALIQVPSTDGRGAFQDPTHVSYWNENSFLYYTDQQKARFIHTPVRFQEMRKYTTPKDKQQVCWTVAHLVKLAPGIKVPGLVSI